MFFPRRHFNSIADITPAFLKEKGLRGIVLDIDNTLVTYGTKKPTAEVIQWINGLQKEGFDIAIASNNNQERIDCFCDGLSVYRIHKSAKPTSRCIRLTGKEFALKPSEICIVGDQIFTDVLCGNFSGAYSILVTPLRSPESRFIRFKRRLEKPIIRAYRKKHPDEF